MSKTKNISDFKFRDFNLDLGLDLVEPEDDNTPVTTKELTDDIKSFRQKNHEFAATKDHETYLLVMFSCKEDKKIFLKNVKLEEEHTLIDGYELARNLKITPTKPAFKLKAPLWK